MFLRNLLLFWFPLARSLPSVQWGLWQCCVLPSLLSPPPSVLMKGCTHTTSHIQCTSLCTSSQARADMQGDIFKAVMWAQPVKRRKVRWLLRCGCSAPKFWELRLGAWKLHRSSLSGCIAFSSASHFVHLSRQTCKYAKVCKSLCHTKKAFIRSERKS